VCYNWIASEQLSVLQLFLRLFSFQTYMRKIQKAQDKKDKDKFAKMFPKAPPAPAPAPGSFSAQAVGAGAERPVFTPTDVDWVS
jgi:hypothetical protein